MGYGLIAALYAAVLLRSRWARLPVPAPLPDAFAVVPDSTDDCGHCSHDRGLSVDNASSDSGSDSGGAASPNSMGSGDDVRLLSTSAASAGVVAVTPVRVGVAAGSRSASSAHASMPHHRPVTPIDRSDYSSSGPNARSGPSGAGGTSSSSSDDADCTGSASAIDATADDVPSVPHTPHRLASAADLLGDVLTRVSQLSGRRGGSRACLAPSPLARRARSSSRSLLPTAATSHSPGGGASNSGGDSDRARGGDTRHKRSASSHHRVPPSPATRTTDSPPRGGPVATPSQRPRSTLRAASETPSQYRSRAASAGAGATAGLFVGWAGGVARSCLPPTSSRNELADNPLLDSSPSPRRVPVPEVLPSGSDAIGAVRGTDTGTATPVVRYNSAALDSHSAGAHRRLGAVPNGAGVGGGLGLRGSAERRPSAGSAASVRASSVAYSDASDDFDEVVIGFDALL